MTSILSDYVSTVGNRDRVLGIVQFLPALLEAPLIASGKPNTAKALSALGSVADQYRTLTRFGITLDMVDPAKWVGALRISDPVLRNTAVAENATLLMFAVAENTTFLKAHGVLSDGNKSSWGAFTLLMWYYNLMLGNARLCYTLLKAYPGLSTGLDVGAVKRRSEFQRAVLQLVKNLSFTLFCASLMPARGKQVQLFAGSTGGICGTINKAFAVATPFNVPLNKTMRGFLGLLATLIDIYLNLNNRK